MKQKTINPRVFFLMDAAGAVISAIMLGYVLVTYQSYIGMPIKTLSFLASIAKIFALYGFICAIFTPKNWQQNLRWIAIANALYCIITLGLTVYHFRSLTLLGMSYFLLEMLIILILVRFELRVSTRP